MINANVLKGINELLEQRGILLRSDQTFGDMVSRALNISNHQSEVLLEALHEGASVEAAASAAGIDPANTEYDVLIAIERAVRDARSRPNGLRC
jgi:hypothetical protein